MLLYEILKGFLFSPLHSIRPCLQRSRSRPCHQQGDWTCASTSIRFPGAANKHTDRHRQTTNHHNKHATGNNTRQPSTGITQPTTHNRQHYVPNSQPRYKQHTSHNLNTNRTTKPATTTTQFPAIADELSTVGSQLAINCI